MGDSNVYLLGQCDFCVHDEEVKEWFYYVKTKKKTHSYQIVIH